jgi:hypothetical protein
MTTTLQHYSSTTLQQHNITPLQQHNITALQQYNNVFTVEHGGQCHCCAGKYIYKITINKDDKS